MKRKQCAIRLLVNLEDGFSIDNIRKSISDTINKENGEMVDLKFVDIEAEETENYVGPSYSITYRDEENPEGSDIRLCEYIEAIEFIKENEEFGRVIKEIRPYGNDEGISIIMASEAKSNGQM